MVDLPLIFPGVWSIDTGTHAAGQTAALNHHSRIPFRFHWSGDNSLEPFDILTELTLPKVCSQGLLVDPSESGGRALLVGLSSFTGEDKRTFHQIKLLE